MFSMWKKAKKSTASENGVKRQTKASTLRPTAGFGLVWRAYDIDASVVSDVGCQRELNEDSGTFVNPDNPDLLAAKGVLLLVADGVGGHSAGEVASGTAAEVISRVYYEHDGAMQTSLVEAFREANRQIYSAAS